VRSPRRRTAARLAQRAHHRWRSSVHEALVGARSADRIRAHVHPSVRRIPPGGGARQGAGADVPRRAGDRLRDRRGVEVGEERTMGERRHGAAGRCGMNRITFALLFVSVALLSAQPPQRGQGGGRGGGGPRGAEPLVLDDHTGFAAIFDGMTMMVWVGDTAVFRAYSVAIVGQSTEQNTLNKTTIIIRRVC